MGSADRDAQLKEQHERAERILSADHFTALGLPRTAGPDDAQKAFVTAAKQWHPDRVPPDARELAPLYARVFSRLEVARGTLTDPHRRQKYIEELFSGPKPGRPLDASALEAGVELKKAEVLLKKSDLKTAEAHLRRVVHLAPGNVLAQALLVWVQVKPTSTPEELAKHVADLDRLVALDAQCERAVFFRAQLKKRLGKEKEAYADFARAADLDKNNIDAQREVRLYKMRQEKAAEQGGDKTPSSGVGQFFQKLFKR